MRACASNADATGTSTGRPTRQTERVVLSRFEVKGGISGQPVRETATSKESAYVRQAIGSRWTRVGRPAADLTCCHSQCSPRRSRRIWEVHPRRGLARRKWCAQSDGSDRGRQHRLRLRRVRGQAAALGRAEPGPVACRRVQDQPPRRARLRRFRGRAPCRTAGGRLCPVRHRGQRGRGRRYPPALGRVRERGDAALRGDQQAEPRASRLSRSARPGAAGIRRQGGAALRSRAPHGIRHRRPRRAALPDGVGLLRVRDVRPQGPRARRQRTQPARRPTRHPDRRDHRGVRGRKPDGPLHGWGGHLLRPARR